MESGSLASTQNIVGKLCNSLALEGITVSRAQIASIVRTAIGIRESWAGIGWGNGCQTGVRQGRNTTNGFIRAAGADQAHEGCVGRKLRSGCSATFRSTTGVFSGQQDVMTKDLAPFIVDGDLDTALGVFTE